MMQLVENFVSSDKRIGIENGMINDYSFNQRDMEMEYHEDGRLFVTSGDHYLNKEFGSAHFLEFKKKKFETGRCKKVIEENPTFSSFVLPKGNGCMEPLSDSEI